MSCIAKPMFFHTITVTFKTPFCHKNGYKAFFNKLNKCILQQNTFFRGVSLLTNYAVVSSKYTDRLTLYLAMQNQIVEQYNID